MSRDDLIRRLEAAGVRPRRPLGQNFLTDANLLAAIVRDAALSSNDVVLEVGTGTASLTLLLAEHAKHVVTVEVDEALAALARDRLSRLENVTLLERDVLADKAHLAPEVVAAWRAQLDAAGAGARARVVANLPYAISTPVVVHLLELDLPLDRMTVMVQLEVAERFVAPPGDPQHNAVSVLVARMAESTKVLRKIPPAVFWPRPKVASAVVEIVPRTPRGARDPVYPALKTIARALFNYRRKTIATAAKSAAKQEPKLARVLEALSAAGIDREKRAEQLTQGEWSRLAELCAADLAGLTDAGALDSD